MNKSFKLIIGLCFLLSVFSVFAQQSSPLDYLKTTRLYQQAQAGDLVSMSRLALIYRYGDGKAYVYSAEDGQDIPVIDLREAFYWFKKSSEMGDLDSLYHLALLHLEESQGDFKLAELGANEQDGLKAGLTAAQRGHVLAMSELHKYYLGPGDNLEQALYWEKQAAKGGHIPSKYSIQMGNFYSTNSEWQQEAVQWFLDFVYKNTGKFGTYAMGHIAEAYAKGIGLDPDPVKAYAWQSLYVKYYPACQDSEAFRQELLAEYKGSLSAQDIQKALDKADAIQTDIETRSGNQLVRLDFDCAD